MDRFIAFDHLSEKLSSFFPIRSDSNRVAFLQIFTELNELNYRYPIVRSPTLGTFIIHQCCSNVRPDDASVTPKCAEFFKHLILDQRVPIEGATLTLTVQWCIKALEVNPLHCLQILESLLKGNIQNIENEQYSTAILKIIKSNPPDNILLAAIKCLEASTVVVTQPPKNFLTNYFARIRKVFLEMLCNTEYQPKQLHINKLLESSLLGLNNIFTVDGLSGDLGQVLAIIRSYMLYNIEAIEFVQPEQLVPAQLSMAEIPLRERPMGKLIPQRKPQSSDSRKKKKSTDYLPTLSDYTSCDWSHITESEFSDNEGGNLARLNRSCTTVRQAALKLFCTVIRIADKATLFTYWTSFIPESKNSKQNLLSCILYDKSTRSRIYALNALLLLLTHAKLYLRQAEYSERTNFTPFSVAIGLMLNELHRSLCLALYQPRAPIAQILKCLAALVQATPYHRLTTGLISKVVRTVKPLITHKDSAVRTTFLLAMGCVLKIDPPVPEVIKVMTIGQSGPQQPHTAIMEDLEFVNFSSSDEEQADVEESTAFPWLLQVCIDNLRQETVPSSIKIECLQIMIAMSFHYFERLLLPHLATVTQAIRLSLQSKNEDLILHACRTIDFFGTAMEALTDVKCLQFWIDIFDDLVSLIDIEPPNLRSAIYECFGGIGSAVYEQFARDKQIVCITLLFNATRDVEATVRGAAIRSLAQCLLYKPLQEDPGFMEDTAEVILQLLKDPNVNVVIKASWALASLAEVLVEHHQPDCPNPKTLLKLLGACLNKTDKLMVNYVRATGSFLYLLNSNDLIEETCQKLTVQLLDMLIDVSTGSNIVKTRWNACRALSCAIKNPHLYTTMDPGKFQSKIFPKLIDLLINFNNFKVRINAAVALSAPTDRAHYGTHFLTVYIGMLYGLENAQNIDDFRQYQHQDNLVDQICLGLAHLTTLLTNDDLVGLDDIIGANQEFLSSQVLKVSMRLVPERAAELVPTITVDGQNEAQKRLIANLKSIFLINK